MTKPLPWVLSAFCFAAIAVLTGYGSALVSSSETPLVFGFILWLLWGSLPFFLRRTTQFSANQLVLLLGVGLTFVVVSWLVHTNLVVFAWLALTWLTTHLGILTEEGRRVEAQIQLEKASKAPSSSWSTPTEQSQNMLWLMDMATVFVWGLILLSLVFLVPAAFAVEEDVVFEYYPVQFKPFGSVQEDLNRHHFSARNPVIHDEEESVSSPLAILLKIK